MKTNSLWGEIMKSRVINGLPLDSEYYTRKQARSHNRSCIFPKGTPVGRGVIRIDCVHRATYRLAGDTSRFTEDGKLSDVDPSLEGLRLRLAAIASTDTCHLAGVVASTIFSPIANSRA
ncbi:hypothetical protein FB451DRAFT_1303462 [Mycena latifolia]|nr:hypothetical protein FB451DRAFT_1303462 [Mycena latifolia]